MEERIDRGLHCAVLYVVMLYLKSVFKFLHRIMLLAGLHSLMNKVSGTSPKYIQATKKMRELLTNVNLLILGI